MLSDLFGKILSPGLESLVHSSQTMVYNFMAKPSEIIEVT